jgi:hypothetical protein
MAELAQTESAALRTPSTRSPQECSNSVLPVTYEANGYIQLCLGTYLLDRPREARLVLSLGLRLELPSVSQQASKALAY